MDTFFEQIVKKKKTAVEWLIVVGTLLVGIALSVFFFYFLYPIGAFVSVGVIYVAWLLITAQNKEFEYCVTNGDIDIDLIISKRKRKRIVSVAGRKIQALLPYDAKVSTHGYQRVVMAAESLQESGLWYFTYHSKKNGRTLVVFHPNERVLGAFYGGLEDQLVKRDTHNAAAAAGIIL
ncbi:MAG: hypothetical protein E7541_05095 [Ruminococcaceae bacterium]|nr:hypothetical protein [Oscillospiraceae bacterium]